jgi:hypothetical protein
MTRRVKAGLSDEVGIVGNIRETVRSLESNTPRLFTKRKLFDIFATRDQLVSFAHKEVKDVKR